MKQKLKLWEYLIETNPNINKIGELGSNGWELVSVAYIYNHSYPNNSIINYYFKRQLR